MVMVVDILVLFQTLELVVLERVHLAQMEEGLVVLLSLVVLRPNLEVMWRSAV